MSVKVVQGLIGEVKSNFAKPNPNSAVNTTQITNAAATAATSTFVSSEAVSVSVRSLRPAGSSERLKDSKEAKELADNVADRVKKDEKSLDAHGLDASKSTQHLS